MCDEKKSRCASAAMVLVSICAFVLSSAFLCGCGSRKDDDADAAGDGRASTGVAADARAMEQFDIGVACLADREYTDAIAAFKKAIAIKPDHAEAYYNMGRAISDSKTFGATSPDVAGTRDSPGGSGPFGDELIAYKKAVALKPDFAAAYEKLGEIYGYLGRCAEEIAAWKKLIFLKPDSDTAHFRMYLAYSRLGQYSEAIAACQRIIALKPDDVGTYRCMGMIYGRAGRYADVIVAYQKALAIYPRAGKYYCTRVYLNMGIAWRELGRYTEAIGAFRKALALRPYENDGYRRITGEVHGNMALVWVKLGRYKEAIGAGEAALAFNPDCIEAHLAMGEAFLETGLDAEAIVACKKAEPGKWQIAEAYSCMGAAYANLGRWSEAMEAYQWVLHIEPDNVHAQFSIGVIHLRLGQYANGLKAFAHVLSVRRVNYETIRLGVDDYQPPSDLPDNEADTKEYVWGYVEGWRRYAGRWHCKVFRDKYPTEHGAWVTCRKDGSWFQEGLEEGQCAAGWAAEDKVLDDPRWLNSPTGAP